jgi:amino acid adenylation domain-containing protein
MSTYQFLLHLYSLNVKLKVDGDRLRCKAPQGVLTQQLQTQIAEYKTELLNFLRHDRGSTISRIAPETKDIPLSFAQERLWFLNQFEGASATYNIPAALRLTGILNLDALHQALAEIVRRHEALRTSFANLSGRPIQVIHSHATLDLEVVNLQHLPDNERELAVKQQIQQSALTPFDLESTPLMRCSLLQLSSTESVFCINMHHIVSDGWSIGVLVQELSALYPAYCAKEPSPLPELEIQYADFAVWQRQWLSGEVLERQLKYWMSQLQGAPELLQLPTDRPRPSVQTDRGATHSLSLSQELAQKLQALSRQSGSTLFMTLMAAFATLLYRYSGESDVVIGSPIANRNRSEIESLIGFFVNTLVLRSRLEDDLSFEQLLQQVRANTLTAYEHQDLPFEQIVEALRPQRSMSHSPLFQVMFDLQNTPLGQVELPGVKLSNLRSEIDIAKFDLTLSMAETPMGLDCAWEYSTDLFETSTIERMASHFENLLSAIVANPQQTVSELPLLSESERDRLLIEWNDTQTTYPQDKCIHQLFEVQVEKTPDQIAVVFEQQELTYRQLNERANQLANYLQTLGVKPEVLVGICVERSIEMVVGLLGILKAGGVYVPLDPSYPAERLSYLLSDAGVQVLLTQNNLLSTLPSHSAQVVYLDTDWRVIESHSQDNLVTGVTPENLAYVIYTSGSTGQPKGVTIPQRNLVEHGTTIAAEYHLTASDRVLQFAALSFDVALEEILPTWLSGATVVLRPQAMLTSVVEWVEFIDTHSLTVLNLPAAFWQEWIVDLATSPQDLPSCLRLVIVGSEQVQWSRVALWQQQVPSHIELYNAYGVTEATITATVYKSDRANQEEQTGIVPIGRPIANTQVYILDPQLQPVPIGVAGELYIGGDGLARGYLNRPELTQAKFIPNPFAPEASARLYKTGDIARYLPDGNIEFLGRIDHQVKIRGFRIELGEIETVLSSHPQIQQAVVISTAEPASNNRLVAYVVSKDEHLHTQHLREFLHQQLPAYMVPSAFMMLDTLPLTPNGKVDRKALPAPDGEIKREQEYVAPQTPNQDIIAQIFATVLGIKEVGIHDNFFDLGGHSLLATQLGSRLKQSFAIDIPLRAIFESPSVAQLDQTISQIRTQGQGVSLPAITRIAPNRTSIPLSFAQERLWFINQLEGAAATYNMPAALRLIGTLDLPAFRQAIAEISRRHETLRTSFSTNNGIPTQLIHAAAIEFEVIDLQHLADSDRKLILTEHIQQSALTPFNLEIAPLIRSSLLQLSETESIFCINMHHIISDGWSIGVLIQELSALYSAYCVGATSPLPELAIQYADFALWQRQWLSGEVLAQQLQYWVSQLQGAPELLQLPTDRPRPSLQTYHGKTINFTLSRELSQQLQGISRQMGSTLFMTLMAAFATLLYRYSGQTDVMIGSPIANRHRSEIESLIGFFVNTLVLRTRLEDNPSFVQLLAQVRETTLQAYEHQDLPFEQLVQALQPQRSMSHSPLFQVMFVLQNAPLGEIELPGLTLCELAHDSTVSQFDLTLSMAETPMGLDCAWEYSTDLFETSTIERMASHFENLLSAIVANPQQPMSELPLLSESERERLLIEWNDTQTTYPQDKCIHQLFEVQVEKTPDPIAVVFEQQELTYRQLNERANQLANYLQTLGVKPEVLVGICVERSIEMVVGLLAILKAGGAYVPLDPSYPTERLSYMLSDAGIQVLLTQEGLLSTLPSYAARVVCVDTDWRLIAPHSSENLVTDVRADNLAYVIYTSGSTGQPKGVPIEHHSLCNLAQAQKHLFGVNPTSRMLQFASIGFDASVSEIFMALTSGARLILGTAAALMPGDDLKQILDRALVTHVTLPPSALSVLPKNELSSLGQIIVAGEACPLELAHQWAVGRRFFNAYGPTESTVCATMSLISENSAKLLIGRPIANTQIYILDRHLHPVPIGVAGELHIGGEGLARGYLNRPELTHAKFIPNPFSPEASARLYKTGDIARYLPDGNIEFLGRIDHQVKIRGFRIELGEIETVLSNHPQVQQAVAIAIADASGNKRLVAYVVGEKEDLSTQQLREFLQQQLPAYMVPSVFVILDTLPLTPNGKVDRKALPALDGSRPDLQNGYVPPTTDLQKTIATIWQEVLQVDKVGMEDNFFDLGGHSLLMVQLHFKLQITLERELSIIELFHYPTISSLSQYYSGISNKNHEDIEARIERQEEGKARLKERLKKRQKIN